MNEWRYKGLDPAVLRDSYVTEKGGLGYVEADLVPGKTFHAPDDWKPSPDPHPSFELMGPWTSPSQSKKKAADPPVVEPKE